MDDDKLQELLNKPKMPKALASTLQQNWQSQQKSESSKSLFIPLIASAAAVLVVLISLVTRPVTPDLVQQALNDIQNDYAHSEGISLPVQTVLDQQGINAPLAAMQLELAKNCQLGQQQALHLALAGSRQGRVHLFIRQDSESHQSGLTEGVADGMHWHLLQPRQGLTVLVLRSEDMDPANVDELVHKMFYT